VPSKKLNTKEHHFADIPNCVKAVLLIKTTTAPATPGVIIDFPFRKSFMMIARKKKCGGLILIAKCERMPGKNDCGYEGGFSRVLQNPTYKLGSVVGRKTASADQEAGLLLPLWKLRLRGQWRISVDVL
jgi:hypothetical protein